MAIKEFEIGPQNYFEEGYFDGDYTLPNVSKSFLQCDVDRVLGGRVVTGEYYQDNYIDGTYYHNNSMSFALSAEGMVVQEAIIRATNYFQDSYYEAGYYADSGSRFSITLDLGQTQEADAAFTVTATVVNSADRLRGFDITANVTATQTAQPLKIIDFAVNAGALFTPSATASITVNSFAVIESITTVAVDAVANRSVFITLENIVNQSLVNDRIRDLNSTHTAEFTQNTNTTRILSAISAQSSEFTQTSNISKVLSASADMSASFTVNAVTEGIAKQAEANITAQSNLTTLAGKLILVSSTQSAVATTSISKYFGSGRPRNFSGSYSFNSSIKKFGSHSLQPSGTVNSLNILDTTTVRPKSNQAFVMEAWVYNTSFGTGATDGFGIGLNRLNSECWIRIVTGGTLEFYSGSSTPATSSSAITLNAWNHILVVANAYTGGLDVSVYVNGTRRITTTRFAPSYTQSYDYFSIRGGITYIDDVSFHVGNTLGYSTGSTTITVPTSARENDFDYTRLLWHMDDNNLDDVSIINRATANISTTSTVSTNARTSKVGASSLSSTATQSTQSVKTVRTDAQLQAQGFAVTAVGRIQSSVADLDSQFALSATVGLNRTAQATLTATTTLTAQGQDLDLASAALTATTALTAEGRFFRKGGVANVTAVSSLTASGVEIPSISWGNARSVLHFDNNLIDEVNNTGVTASGTQTYANTTISAPFEFEIVNPNITINRSNATIGNTVIGNASQWSIDFRVKPKYVSGSYNFNIITLQAESSGLNRPWFIQSVFSSTSQVTFRLVHASVILLGREDGNDILFNTGGLDVSNYTNNWFIISVRRVSSTTAELWVNGNKVDEITSLQSVIQRLPDGRIQIGGLDEFSQQYLGKLDEFRLLIGEYEQYNSNFPYAPYQQGHGYLEPKFTLSANAQRGKLVSANIAAVSTQSTVISRTRTAQASVSSSATLTVNAVKLVKASSAVNVVTQQTTSAIKTARATLSATAEFAVSAVVTRTRDNISAQSAQVTVSAEPYDFTQATATLSTQSTLAISISKFSGNQAVLTTTTAQSIDYTRLRFADIDTDSIATQLTVAAKNATGTVLLESNFAQQTTAVKTTDILAQPSAEFAQSAQAQSILFAQANITADTTQTTVATKFRPANANLSSNFAITIDAVKTTDVTSNNSAEFTQTTLNGRLRDNASTQTSAFTQNTVGVRVKIFTVSANSNSEILATAFSLVQYEATITSQGFVVTAGDVEHIDPYYTYMIEQETRAFQIDEEPRLYTIDPETRVNIIKGSLL